MRACEVLKDNQDFAQQVAAKIAEHTKAKSKDVETILAGRQVLKVLHYKN